MASPIYSTGTTYSTSGAGNTPAVTIPAGQCFNHLALINGGAAGNFSLDGGITPVPFPAGNMVLDGLTLTPGMVISLVRIGSTDMSGVQIFCW